MEQEANNKQILRARWHDYSDHGFYMITINAEDRGSQPFGVIAGSKEEEATMQYTVIGEKLVNAIADISHYYPEVNVREWAVMEDHCHILIEVSKHMDKHIGAVVRALKSVTTKSYLQMLDEKEGGYHLLNRDLSKSKAPANRITGAPATSQNAAQTAATTSHPTATSTHTATSPHTAIPTDSNIASHVKGSMSAPIYVQPLWSAGYHDRIVTKRGQISRLMQYIRRNPARLWAKRHTDRSLMTVRDIQIPLPLDQATKLKEWAMYWDEHHGKVQTTTSTTHNGHVYATTYLSLVQKFLRKKISTHTDGQSEIEPFIKIRCCGNAELLSCGRPLVRVRISRSVTQEQFEAELHRLLDMCEHEGAVLISPFVSWSEKEVLKAARMNHYPHIIINGESMSTFFKPSDAPRNADAQYIPEWHKYNPLVTEPNGYMPQSDMQCIIEGKLLIMSPWHDRPKSERLGKADFEIMNELSAILCEQ